MYLCHKNKCDDKKAYKLSGELMKLIKKEGKTLMDIDYLKCS